MRQLTVEIVPPRGTDPFIHFTGIIDGKAKSLCWQKGLYQYGWEQTIEMLQTTAPRSTDERESQLKIETLLTVAAMLDIFDRIDAIVTDYPEIEAVLKTALQKKAN